MTPRAALRAVRIVHTVVWAFFAGCICAIPVAAWMGRFTHAAVLAAVVFVEVAILAVNQMRCPLTDVAARYTPDRADNFDIYLPLWLARHNKFVFGALYVAGMLYAFVHWVSATG
jgi:hypothetical protein